MRINSRLIRLASILITVCLLTGLFTSCNKSTSKTLRLPLSAKTPTCYDPQIATGIDLENIINNCFEGLVRINADGQVVNGVSDSWTVSSDETQYSFHIRNDAQWYIPNGLEDLLGENYKDTFGTHVTAYDFEFALKRALDKDTNAALSETLSYIKSVYAKDDTTLVISLYKPSASFLATLATPICMPCNEKFFEATAGRYGLETKLLLCNGPYYLSSFDEVSGVTLSKNDRYYGEYEAISDYVKFVLPSTFSTNSSDENKETTTSSTTANVFNYLYEDDGGYDAASVTAAESKKLNSNIFNIKKYKNAVKAICFNCNSEQISDDIRLAFVYATNIETLLGSEPKAEGIVPACCGLAPGVSYRAGSNIISPPKEDHKTALEYIQKGCTITDEDGKETTQPLNLSLNFVLLKEDEVRVKEMIQIWQKVFGVGLSITITTCETQEDLDSLVNGGAYDIAFTNIPTSEFLASGFLRSFDSNSGKNIINLKSEEYDLLLTNIFNASSESELLQANKEAEEYIVENGYIIPIAQADSYLAIKTTATDISVRPSGAVYALYK